MFKFSKVKRVKNLSKLGRLLHNPYKYLIAIYTRFIHYPLTKKGSLTRTLTFFGKPMYVLLPAGTDIYLTGGKSHDSEIRLSTFIIKQLQSGDVFVDVGAHFGFFSLLASEITGSQGMVLAYEGGEETFKILDKNVKFNTNIKCLNKVVSDVQGEINFYQFPSAYSEYNSLDIGQYKDADWIKSNPPKSILMDSVTLSNELKDNVATIIKIDVEGGELAVLNGLEKYLENEDPIVVIEYLSSERNNKTHILAVQFLQEKGFKAHTIKDDGAIKICDDIENYMAKNSLDSDNLVFARN